MRFLHLVLYSQSDPYFRMVDATKKWYQACKEHFDIDTIYYCFDKKIWEPEIETENGMTLWKFIGQESFLPGCLDKTLDAFAYVQEQKIEYDYIIRSNASTVINLKLLKDTIMKHIACAILRYGGPLVELIRGVTSDFGYVDEKDLPFHSVTGTCILLHKSAIELILQHKARVQRDLLDDLSLAVFFKKMSIELQDTSWLPQKIGSQFLGYLPFHSIDSVHAFRNQNYNNRDANCTDVETECQVLLQRYMIIPHKQRIAKVLYHNVDVTSFILLLCKQNGAWVASTKNEVLDDLFGDPAPGAIKVLELQFANDGIPSFKHAANWVFILDPTSRSHLCCF